MKNLLTHYTLWALLVLCTACDFDLDLFPDKPKELPPITTTGERTFGCMVNGELFLPKGSSSGAIYQNGFLSVGAGIEVPDQNIDLLIFQQGGIDVKNYDLTDTSSVAKFNYLSEEEGICWYDAEHTIEGNLEILYFDPENYIVSGVFDFTTVNGRCDTIRVTDGRFDLIYTP